LATQGLLTRTFMTISINERTQFKAHQLKPSLKKTSAGLLAGWLMLALLAGGCSKPTVKDPRLQPPRVEIFKAEVAGSNSRTFTGIVEARVQSDLGFRGGG